APRRGSQLVPAGRRRPAPAAEVRLRPALSGRALSDRPPDAAAAVFDENSSDAQTDAPSVTAITPSETVTGRWPTMSSTRRRRGSSARIPAWQRNFLGPRE